MFFTYWTSFLKPEKDARKGQNSEDKDHGDERPTLFRLVGTVNPCKQDSTECQRHEKSDYQL